MGLLNCVCPLAAAIPSFAAQDCPENIGQIQKLVFQVGQSTAPFDSSVPANDQNLLSVWTAYKSATDSTKIAVTPFIGGDPIIGAGAAITTGGGDNSTLNGVEQVEGKNPAPFTCFYRSQNAAFQTTMENLFCWQDQLTVYFILVGGRIMAESVTTTAIKGFRIQTPTILDVENNGFGTDDRNAVSFYMPAGWSKNRVIFTPSGFNPLTQL